MTTRLRRHAWSNVSQLMQDEASEERVLVPLEERVAGLARALDARLKAALRTGSNTVVAYGFLYEVDVTIGGLSPSESRGW